jgi:hypothetical protein
MTQALKIDRILDLVELTATQVNQLTFQMAEVKEEIVGMKLEIAGIQTEMAGVKDELSRKADKEELRDLRSTMDYKFELIRIELDKKPNRDELQTFKDSVNENDTAYAEIFLDHSRRLKRLERA